MAAAVLLAAWVGGCRTSKWYDYSFTPSPQEARLSDERVPDSQARALVTLAGIRKASKGNPARVEVLMRMQNLGAVPVVLRRKGLELVSADLVAFPPADIVLTEVFELQPQESIVYVFGFELPQKKKPKDFNFEGAVFSWEVDFGAGPVATSINFQRLPAYDTFYHTHTGPGWGYGYPYYGGYYGW